MDLFLYIANGILIIIIASQYLFIIKSGKQHRSVLEDYYKALEDKKNLYLKINEISALKGKEVLNVDAQQLLHDITRHGNAVLEIKVLDPSQLFYRSPNG